MLILKYSINNLFNLVKMLILGIETSCDETAASVIRGRGDKIEILSNIVSSQINIHKKYGGVVPEVAAREHVLQILPVVNEALENANLTLQPPIPTSPLTPLLNRRGEPRRGGNNGDKLPSYLGGAGLGGAGGGINAITVTIGPGLITSLLVGVETAKILSYVWNIPVVGMNHIEGHIYANFIGRKQKTENRKQTIEFPAVVLTVSGGHTMLVLMTGHGKYKTIGETRDDAAGEAFDKAAKLLGLGYPGGPIISDYAEKYIKQSFKISNSKFRSVAKAMERRRLISNKIPNPKLVLDHNRGSQIPKNKSKIILPRPMINSESYDFSFSGLKTALLYQIKKDKNWEKRIHEYCAEFQQAVIDVLIHKTVRAVKEYKAKTVMLTGGVAANKELRPQFEEAVNNKLEKVQFIMSDLSYTTDNAAMVATAGYYNALKKKFTPWQELRVDCNLEL